MFLEAIQHFLDVLIAQSLSGLQFLFDGLLLIGLLLLQSLARLLDLLGMNLQKGFRSVPLSISLSSFLSPFTFSFSFMSLIMASRFSTWVSILVSSCSLVWVMNSLVISSFLRVASSTLASLMEISAILRASKDCKKIYLSLFLSLSLLMSSSCGITYNATLFGCL